MVSSICLRPYPDPTRPRPLPLPPPPPSPPALPTPFLLSTSPTALLRPSFLLSGGVYSVGCREAWRARGGGRTRGHLS